MLCSKHAKQPEVWAVLGSSYVMKLLRLVPILALVAAFAAACGGGSGAPKSVPNDAVAVVGSDTITKVSYNQTLDQAKRSYKAQNKPFPKPGTAAVLNTNVGQIAALFYNNNTYYDGLQAGLNKKLSHGFQA